MYEKLYEDNATSKVTDKWFMQLSYKYKVERLELKAKIVELRGKKKSSAHSGLKSVMNTRYGTTVEIGTKIN